MGVVYIREIYKGVGLELQTRAGKSEGTTSRKFLVRVDSFSVTARKILGAVGIKWNAEHPGLPGWRANNFSVSCEDGTGLMWLVEAQYKIEKQATPDALPADEWSISSASSLVPLFQAYKTPTGDDKKMVVNSAGSPIEGLKKEAPEIAWQLTRSFKTAAELLAAARLTNNKVNATDWAGGKAKCWKCDFKSGREQTLKSPKQTAAGDPAKESEGADGDVEEVKYWVGVFEFRYSFSTWELKPWDAGYMQKVDTSGDPSRSGTALAAILGKDGKPVKEQAMLDGHGVALPAGDNPVALVFDVYQTVDLAATFGSPPS